MIGRKLFIQLICALGLLATARVAGAQSWPATTPNGYYPGYGSAPQPGALYDTYGHAWYGASTGAAPYFQPAPAQNIFPVGPNPQAMSAPATPVADAPSAPPTGTAPATASPPVAPADGVKESCGPQESAPAVPPEPEQPYVNRFYISAGYTMLYISPERLNTPLVTLGSPLDTHPGALGEPGTSILFGDRVNYEQFSGAQGEAGFYLDPERHISLNWSGFYVSPRHVDDVFASDATGSPLITRPIFNVLTGTQASFLDAYPGLVSGSATVRADAELYGTEGDIIFHLYPNDHLFIDGLTGFRFLHLAEGLSVTDQLQPLTAGFLTFNGTFIAPPDILSDLDSFRTRNNFYGGQVGTQVGWEGKRFFVNGFAKLGLGATDQSVNIQGNSTLTTPTGSQQATGGILAQSSNIGEHNRTVFGLVPEGGIEVGVHLTHRIEFQVGYSFLWWNDVVRPGRQIDAGVNPNQVPTAPTFGMGGPARPAFSFAGESLWIQSFNCALGIHF